MSIDTGLYLLFTKRTSLLKVWKESKKEILAIAILQNGAYLLVLMAMQMSKVSYVVAFRQAGALFGAGMGIVLLKEGHWKPRITGALILTFGLLLIGLAK
jgi:drug/metabolite transporter (DMT)-like permease